jgi:hypothetical protein
VLVDVDWDRRRSDARAGIGIRGRNGIDRESVGTALAPEYSDKDVELIWVASEFSEARLLVCCVH